MDLSHLDDPRPPVPSTELRDAVVKVAHRRRTRQRVTAIAAVGLITVVAVFVGVNSDAGGNSEPRLVLGQGPPPEGPNVVSFQCCGDAIVDLDKVVDALRPTCQSERGEAVVWMKESKIRIVIPCREVRSGAVAIGHAAATAVAQRNNARQRSKDVERVFQRLGLRQESDLDTRTWMLGIVDNDFRCDAADDREFRVRELGYAKEQGESDINWLMIEAGYIAGACPERLEAIFNVVADAGHQRAVDTVRATFAAKNIGGK